MCEMKKTIEGFTFALVYHVITLSNICVYCWFMMFRFLCVCQDGATALILAAQMSRVEICVFLLGRDANANIQDSQGRYWTVGVLSHLQVHLSKLWKSLFTSVNQFKK